MAVHRLGQQQVFACMILTGMVNTGRTNGINLLSLKQLKNVNKIFYSSCSLNS